MNMWKYSVVTKLLLLHFALLIPLQGLASPEELKFRVSLFSVPRSLDPIALGSTEAHIFHNLYRGLYIYRTEKRLIPVGAKSCTWSPFPKVMTCHLNPKHKWSDGSQVLAEDYVRAFRRLVDPKNSSRDASELFALSNYKLIMAGTNPPESLGILAVDPETLKFTFDEVDVDFKFRLASPSLIPFRRLSSLDAPQTWLFNGPYELKEWKQEQYVRLEPSRFYIEKNIARPSIEIRIVEDGTAALNLYQTGRLDLVTLVPTSQIPEWKVKPGYFETAIPRFDFVGFGPALKDYPQLRKAMSLASDFKGFQRLFQSKSRPGCPGFPSEWTNGPVCLADDVNKAKSLLNSFKSKIPLPLTYYFTQIPTDDLRRGAEFYQQAWKKNLGLTVDLQSREIGVYRQLLKDNPPPVFRRGVALDRPTCLAALERFETSSSDNEIQFHNKEFDKVIESMRATENVSASRVLCRKGLEILYQENALIPQGEYYLGRVINPKFKGLTFTSHGSLDFTFLQRVSN